MKDIKSSEKLMTARSYEAQKVNQIPQIQRPVYHMSVPTGWCNDPNGFSFFKDHYHLFFQYHPYSTKWGPMHWGHYTTKDFIKWEMRPCALAPDMEYDCNGCFSGTGIEWKGMHLLMYTGVNETETQNHQSESRQVQCVAFGDGTDYQKYEHNPVITADMLPAGSSRSDFRDPKIWEDEEGLWTLVGSRNEDGSGQLALFYSEDALTWRFVKILDYCKNEYGKMWECPDFFSLDGEQVLIVSPQDMMADGKQIHNGNNNVYFVGGYDSRHQIWSRNQPYSLDFGLDFYAAQTVLAEDGRRILIGWMESWDNDLTPDDYEWSGTMTIPRELTMANHRIRQYPVRELEQYRKEKVAYRNLQLYEEQQEIEISQIRGRCLDMDIDLKDGDFSKFTIIIAASQRHRTMITYERKERMITLDRTMSGMCRDLLSARSMPVQEKKGKLQLRILLDRNSVELFVNHGEQAMTALIYTPIDADHIYFKVDGKACIDIEKYNIVVRVSPA